MKSQLPLIELVTVLDDLGQGVLKSQLLNETDLRFEERLCLKPALIQVIDSERQSASLDDGVEGLVRQWHVLLQQW